ncbi:hypothetical protein QQX98_001269 [Neonectria punicea]|uniref:Prion-inhibition and propagation HeLo domain-containing protein n=1 Tax=Neonectria punicea TaxID=979145 RepID=A0ABR1HP88_9HYPO
MSGFEVAGIVLGAFPILTESCKDLRSVFRSVKSWWRFENDFDNFVAAIQREQIAFSQNLEILIDPLDLPDVDKETLQNDSGSDLWHQPRVQMQLRRRVQGRYHEWFMEQLADINSAVNKLHKLLPIGKVYLIDSTSLEGEMFRLKTSFSSQKDELLKIIKDRNEDLFQFLSRASHVAQATKAKPSVSATSITPFLTFQSQARQIYECVQRHWTCTCTGVHPCGVTISPDLEKKETLEMRLLFREEAKLTNLKVRLDVARPKVPQPQACPTKDEDLAVLRKQMALKEQMKKKVDKSPRGFLYSLGAAAMSSIEARARPESKSWDLERPPARLKKRLFPSRDKKQVVASDSVSLATSGTSSTSVVTEPTRRVRFAEDDSTASSEQMPEPATLMQDLCSLIKAPVDDPEVRFWDSGLESRVLLLSDSTESTQPQEDQLKSLEDFVQATSRRDKRLEQAVLVLHTLLCLGPLPWVPLTWKKSQVFLHAPDWDTNEPKPYLSHASLKLAILDKPASLTPAEKAKTCMFAIGVLLLELLFRESLERQPYRAGFLGPTGQPNEFTDLCTAMQWQKRVEEECGYGLADAIRRCILCSFDAAPDLSNPLFVQAVWQGVGEPVEEFLSAWKRGPRI